MVALLQLLALLVRLLCEALSLKRSASNTTPRRDPGQELAEHFDALDQGDSERFAGRRRRHAGDRFGTPGLRPELDSGTSKPSDREDGDSR